MVRTEWRPDGQQLVREIAAGDADALAVGQGRTAEGDLVLRLDHQHRKAWYAVGEGPGAEWRETDYANVLEWAWDGGLLLGPREPAVYGRLDPRMQAFICNGEVYAVSDDGIVVDTDLQRSVTEAELRVEMVLAGGAEFCGPGCQGE